MSAKMQEKLIEEISGLTVLELADLVKALEDKFGVSAAMPTAAVAAAPAAAAAAVAEEKSEYKVTLKECDESKKIAVIKALRKVVPTLNLSDAKAMTENTPAVVLDAAPKDKAKEIKAELEAAGAKVELS